MGESFEFLQEYYLNVFCHTQGHTAGGIMFGAYIFLII